MEKNSPANAGDVRNMGSIPGLGRSPEGRRGNPLQYSCLKNPMDRGAWRATVHGVAKSGTRLSDLAHVHAQSWTPEPAYQDQAPCWEECKCEWSMASSNIIRSRGTAGSK